jgi:hypothetical protein
MNQDENDVQQASARKSSQPGIANAGPRTLQRHPRFAWLSTWWTEITAALVSLSLGIYQLSLPNVLSGVLPVTRDYDEGVYIGVSIRLVHGVLPYRDFVFVHPPGIALLMSPVALFGVLTGSSASSLILARILSLMVVATNVVLAGRLVRPVGRVAVAVTSFSLALWPLAVAVDRNLELEPYLVLFCLLGALLVFRDDGEHSSRRAFFGGLAFGCALAVKVWAFMPIVAVVLVLLPRWRRQGWRFVLGVATAVTVTCLPFFLAAPDAFVHDVFVDQFFQQPALNGASFGEILLIISGFAGFTFVTVPSWVAGLLFVAVIVIVLAVYGIGWRRRTRLEWYILASVLITFLGMLHATYFEDHYGYFVFAMLAPLLGVCAGRAWSHTRAIWSRLATSETRSRIVIAVSLAVALGFAVFAVQQDVSYDQSYTAGASSVAPLDSFIPAGACVISAYPASLVMLDRFTPSNTGCPTVIDPYGMYLSDDDGGAPHVGGAFPATFTSLWFADLKRANYVELRLPLDDFIPWTNSMIRWFQNNYVQVAALPENYLYKRVSRP